MFRVIANQLRHVKRRATRVLPEIFYVVIDGRNVYSRLCSTIMRDTALTIVTYALAYCVQVLPENSGALCQAHAIIQPEVQYLCSCRGPSASVNFRNDGVYPYSCCIITNFEIKFCPAFTYVVFEALFELVSPVIYIKLFFHSLFFFPFPYLLLNANERDDAGD